MGKSLIIVESPAKIKTLQKFLGKDFVFASSFGHIRDLPAKEFGIDTEGEFDPKYTVLPDKKDVVSKLKKAAAGVDVVYLSPDPDREGEAIAWHIASILPKGTKIKRAAFHSITKRAVLDSLANPKEIDCNLVDAQQARRLLDRIVGYKISPLLARRIQRQGKGSLSAGRVQSVALKLVVDREKEIDAFTPVEYWNITALLSKQIDGRATFRAFLYAVDGKKVEKEAVEGKDVALVSKEKDAIAVVDRLKVASYTVARVEKKEKKRHPVPPFITSTLQQEASRHFGYSASRTMSVAQSLYEGIDLGREGSEGLITYMRTDSVRVAPEAVHAVRELIKQQYGPQYLPDQPKNYSTKKSAQDAHEAIRPTNFSHPPDSVRASLTKDQYNLYSLVWKRFIASQMMAAVYDTVSCDIATDNGILLRATGSVQKFNGFLVLYEEKNDDDERKKDALLPPLAEGENLSLEDLFSEQAFTRPPPRYTEASLVKELEKSGIGRPSTYAAIMNKIQSREYTTKEGKALKPTELGRVIASFLESSFQQIININFTAKMEDSLELIAEGKKEWKALIKEFWHDFIPILEEAEKTAFVPKIMTDIDCPKCKQNKLQKVWARSKYFYGCSGYPDCEFSTSIEELNFDKSEYAEGFDWDQSCPSCAAQPMRVRHGRFGPFLGCSHYPECKGIVNIPKKGEEIIDPETLSVCPAIGCDGKLRQRKSRYGKMFYSCSNYPECDVIANSLDTVETKYQNYPKTAYVKKTKASVKQTKGREMKKTATKTAKKTTTKKTTTKKTGTRSTAITAPQPLSKELADLVGTNTLSRGNVMKKVWEYIKGKDLQDAKDRRTINPDAKLGKVLGSTKPISMFKMTGLLSKHIG
ncbi:type I DNA topoisomerase [Simkania negevensis]|uniref:DNA topoisomerase 1 n=1 Tax=Simkania negevensis TaxID=83561 RepID=A0ABS3AQK1_9BACT|nr:type I DNA topoisomerase [Simkania negevensis]